MRKPKTKKPELSSLKVSREMHSRLALVAERDRRSIGTAAEILLEEALAAREEKPASGSVDASK